MTDIPFLCRITKRGLLKLYTFDVQIPNYIKFFDDNTNHEFETKGQFSYVVPESTAELRMLLKFNFRRCNNVMDIYYQSLDPVVVMTSVLLKYTKNTNYGLQEDYYSIYNKAHHILEPYNWHHLKKFKKGDFYNMYKINPNLFIKLKLHTYIVSEKVDGTLCNDFKCLLNDETFSDMSILSSEHIKYKAHKAVLASRSPVMKAHFEHNTTECETHIMKSVFESEVLSQVLIYVYSDVAPRLHEIPDKILPAADFYQLTRLKSLCEDALHKKLAVDNAIQLLQLADLHSAEKLKQFAIEFIKNQAGLIIKTDSWAQFNCVKLMKMIFEEIIIDKA